MIESSQFTRAKDQIMTRDGVVFDARPMVGSSLMNQGLTNLVLDQELDTLNGGSSGLGDSGGDTTHCGH